MLNIWKTLAVLNHHHPLSHEVTIEHLPDAEGTTDYDEEKGVFSIRISDTVEEGMRSEVLVHEWAHCLCHEYSGPCADAVWGVCYAGLYILIFGEH